MRRSQSLSSNVRQRWPCPGFTVAMVGTHKLRNIFLGKMPVTAFRTDARTGLPMRLNAVWALTCVLIACANSSPAPTRAAFSDGIYLDSPSDQPIAIEGYKISSEVSRLDELLMKYPLVARSGGAELPVDVVISFGHLSLREKIEAAALEGRVDRPLMYRWARLLAKEPRTDTAKLLTRMLDEPTPPTFGASLILAADKLEVINGFCITKEFMVALRRRASMLPSLWHPEVERQVAEIAEAPSCE